MFDLFEVLNLDYWMILLRNCNIIKIKKKRSFLLIATYFLKNEYD